MWEKFLFYYYRIFTLIINLKRVILNHRNTSVRIIQTPRIVIKNTYTSLLQKCSLIY